MHEVTRPRRAALAKTLLALAAAALAFALAPAGHAGVAIDNAVVLDPFDPTPPIQFEHWYGGYHYYRDGCCGHYRRGCDGCRDRVAYDCDGCGCRDNCGCRDGCDGYRRDGCCEQRDGCDGCRPRCEGACGTDLVGGQPCDRNCYDAERWEHRWRNGDRMGQEWYDSGRREHQRSADHGGRQWYGNDDQGEWRDNGDDDDSGPPPPPSPADRRDGK